MTTAMRANPGGEFATNGLHHWKSSSTRLVHSVQVMLTAGATCPYDSLPNIDNFSAKQAGAVSSVQPRGKALPPFVSEFESIQGF